MIKESKYRVNPNVLSCLLHLRLKTEIDVRASKTSTDRHPVKHRSKEKRGKGTAATQTHLSKKAKKVLREKEAIRKDIRDVGVEVDREERNKTVWNHPSGFLWAKVIYPAYGDAKTCLRPLLPNSQEPMADAASARRARRNRQVLTPRQR